MPWGKWGGLGSDLLRGNFAKNPDANGVGLGSELFGETLISALGLIWANGGGFATNFLGGNFAKYPEANGAAWQRTFAEKVLLSALGLIGVLGSKLFGGRIC